MLAAIRTGLTSAWLVIATWVPKFVGFLIVLLIGYLFAKALQRAIKAVLNKIGFNKWVERGGVRRALAKSGYEVSDILGILTYYVVMLFTLQLAFGIFGPNPVSALLTQVVAYLPNVFAAVLLVVIGAAIASAARDITAAALSNLSYGQTLSAVVGVGILAVAIFAALDQLHIAPTIITGLFYALLGIIAGSAIVAIGGGGIKTMQRYWERAANRVDAEAPAIVQAMEPTAPTMTAAAPPEPPATPPEEKPKAA